MSSNRPDPRGGRGRSKRRRRALLALLLALGVGAALFAPGFIELAAPPALLPVARPHGEVRPGPLPPLRRPWSLDFSLGPLLELFEEALNGRPLDVRRPARMPLPPPPRDHSHDILLNDLPQIAQGWVPPSAGAPAPAPPARGRPPRPPAGPLSGPITSGPDRDAGSGAPAVFSPDPSSSGSDSAPAAVPEPGAGPLLALGALLLLRRRRR